MFRNLSIVFVIKRLSLVSRFLSSLSVMLLTISESPCAWVRGLYWDISNVIMTPCSRRLLLFSSVFGTRFQMSAYTRMLRLTLSLHQLAFFLSLLWLSWAMIVGLRDSSKFSQINLLALESTNFGLVHWWLLLVSLLAIVVVLIQYSLKAKQAGASNHSWLLTTLAFSSSVIVTASWSFPCWFVTPIQVLTLLSQIRGEVRCVVEAA